MVGLVVNYLKALTIGHLQEVFADVNQQPP